MNNEERLTIVEVPGYAVALDGRVISDTKGEYEAEQYRLRLLSRYPGSMIDLVYGREEDKKKRGGPYNYVLPTRKKPYPIPMTGTIPAASEKEARQILGSWLEQKRLPNGTEITRAE